MTNDNPNLNGTGNGGQDGGNANQGGDNSQRQGGSGNGNGGQDPNRGDSGNGHQAGDDFKVKFGESTRENQRLMEIIKASGIDPKTGKKADGGDGAGANDQGGAGDPTFFTDDDLAASFPSYGTMSEQEKSLLKNVGSFPKIARMVAEMYDKSTFTEQVEALVLDPANKLIAEHRDEFKKFAYEGNNLKTDIKLLTDAFIGRKLREAAAKGDNGGNGNGDGGKGTKKRSGMENGTNGQGGGNDTATELTADQARELRMKDPRKYAALARSGKLRIVHSDE